MADAIAIIADETVSVTVQGAELVAPLVAAAEAAQAAAEAAAGEAAADVRSELTALVESGGPLLFYDTYADAAAALPGLAEDQLVRILEDENSGGIQVFYRVESGVLVKKLDVDAGKLDLLEIAPEWQVRTKYAVGDRIKRRGTFYRCITAHQTGTTEASWNAANWESLGAVSEPVSQSITLRSGPGNGNTDYDATSRINLESYQALQAGFGEVIRIYQMDPDSYQHIAWMTALNPALPPDPDTNPFVRSVWMGAHYGNQFEGDPHGHWSIEVPGTDLQLRSRFEIKWADPNNGYSYGIDKTNTRCAHSDFTVIAYAQGDTSGRPPVIRLAGAGAEKAIEWNVGTGDDDPDNRRWHLLSDAAADFLSLRRFDDAGAASGTIFHAARSTGNITFGEASAKAARVAAVSSGDNHTFLAQPSSIGASNAAFAALMPATTDRLLQSSVSGESSGRFVITAAGRFEWGSGSAARDVNLYRGAADILTTDDAFAPARIFLNGTTNAYMQFAEQTAAPSASANNARVYAEDNGAGKTRLMVRFGSGAPVQLAIEP